MNGGKKSIRRFLKLLSRRTETGYAFEQTEEEFVVLAEKLVKFPAKMIHNMTTRGAVRLKSKHVIITRTGLELLKQEAGMAPGSTSSTADDNNERARRRVLVNMDESPLLRLYSRKTKNGGAYLSVDEFNAGERLRIDFERGNLQPRITANLGTVAGLSGKGGNHQAHELSDFAIDSRERVTKAVHELGPELSGVALDVCCFLKGLETIERERQWPPRSAKLMLKTALSTLVRHYGIGNPAKSSQAKISGWGSEDFRPYM